MPCYGVFPLGLEGLGEILLSMKIKLNELRAFIPGLELVHIVQQPIIGAEILQCSSSQTGSACRIVNARAPFRTHFAV